MQMPSIRRLLGSLAVVWLAACAGVGSSASDITPAPPTTVARVVTSSTTVARTTTTTSARPAATTITTAPVRRATTTTTRARATTTSTRVAPRQTRCRALTHIGDSLTVGMASEALAGDARLNAQYTRVGVRDPYIDGSGARSVVETLPAQINAYDTAVAQRAAGFSGCWVLEVGTNDAANIAHGSHIEAATRIDRMMSVVGSDPVLWVDVISQIDSGDYSSDNMRMWDSALDDARRRYPNLRVFAWSRLARAEWFGSDGLHYTTDGYTTFARSLADAVTAAFPA